MMEHGITKAIAGSVIDIGLHRLNIEQQNYKPGQITEFGIIVSDDFFLQDNQWQTFNRLVSAEVFGGLALIWMPYSEGSKGKYYQFDGSISEEITPMTIGTVMQVHANGMCELFMNLVPTQYNTSK